MITVIVIFLAILLVLACVVIVAGKPKKEEAAATPISEFERLKSDWDGKTHEAIAAELIGSAPDVALFYADYLRLRGRLHEVFHFLKDRRHEDLPLQKVFAEAAEEIGEIKEALTAYRILNAAGPLSPMDEFRFGRILARLGEFDESIPHLADAHARLSDDPNIARSLAEALDRVGRHKEAWEIYRTLYNHGSDEDRIALARPYAITLEKVGNMQGALDVFRQIAEMPTAFAREKADMLCLEGELLSRMNQDRDAQLRWQKALDVFPNHPDALRLLGLIERPDEAKKLVTYVRSLSMEKFRKLFERILTDWSYTLCNVSEPDGDTLRIIVTRFEDGKDVRKLVFVKRWEDEVGEYPIQDLKSAMMKDNFDAGVFLAATRFSAAAIVFAAKAGNIELFSANELFALITTSEYTLA